MTTAAQTTIQSATRLSKKHEKHAANDNDGRYGAYHGIMRQRQRRSDQENGTGEYDRLLERTNTKILCARTNGGRKTHSHTQENKKRICYTPTIGSIYLGPFLRSEFSFNLRSDQ